MHHNFKAVSLSHKKAPLAIRELIALDETACKQFLQMMLDYLQATDILILSTCNRTEVYYSAEEDLSSEIVKLLGVSKGIENISQYFDFFTILNQHADAVQHLFDVSMGLEAQVVGDMQISNQVKTAYQWSADNNTAGPFLHRLMHAIFFTNKRVQQETSFRDGAASTSYATVELVEELTADIHDPKILVVGLGEIRADRLPEFSRFGFCQKHHHYQPHLSQSQNPGRRMQPEGNSAGRTGASHERSRRDHFFGSHGFAVLYPRNDQTPGGAFV